MTHAPRFRNCCITWNNPIGTPTWDDTKMKYLIYQKERGELGTEHYQIYVEFKNQLGLKTIKSFFHESVHVEARRGTAEQAAEYCKKPDTRIEDPVEYGSRNKQGERTDLDALKQELITGKPLDEITLRDPISYHQYGRTLEKLEDIIGQQKWRTEMTEGIWLWGPTGVGKSHEVFQNYHPNTHYLWAARDKGWWDGYKGQETVIFNDFRGELPYSELLQLIDKWAYKVPRRNREPRNFISKKVIITSSLPPQEIYCNRNEEDKLDQLLRRITVKHVTGSALTSFTHAPAYRKDPPSHPAGAEGEGIKIDLVTLDQKTHNDK